MRQITRIEILFILSVLIFLGTLLFTFTEQSQLRTQDMAKNALAQQYVTALRLFAADHKGNYPYPGSNGEPVCVGSGNPNGECEGGASENTILQNALATYLGGTPASINPLYIKGINYGGIGYVCYAVNNSNPLSPLCKTYGLFWNTNYHSACIQGAISSAVNSCTYIGS